MALLSSPSLKYEFTLSLGGVSMRTTTEIDEKWNDYSKKVAKCQLNNYGVIFLDDYSCPIDNEYELEELYETYQNSKKEG